MCVSTPQPQVPASLTSFNEQGKLSSNLWNNWDECPPPAEFQVSAPTLVEVAPPSPPPPPPPKKKKGLLYVGYIPVLSGPEL